MSGRLIILPKKTYCPWRPENVERVLKDEQRERERLKQQELEQQQLEAEKRLAKLKGSDVDCDVQEKQEHVNLFESEERAMMKSAVSVPQKVMAPSKGIMPVRLDSVLPKNKEKPFYIRTSNVRYDEKRKALMDPMKAFVRKETNPDEMSRRTDCVEGSSATLKSHGESARRKHSSRHYHDTDSLDSVGSISRRSARRRRHDKKRRKGSSTSDKHSSASKGASIAELRRRRQEREHNESRREAALRNQSSARKETSRRYSDVFYPSFSR